MATSIYEIVRHGVNGCHGSGGSDGVNGQFFGASGQNGEVGKAGDHGGDGQDITVTLSTDDQGANILIENHEDPSKSGQMEMDASGKAIRLMAEGGHGGNGGRGGDGGHGSQGRDGRNATQTSNGDDGGQGGNGGNGGNGANGGNSGNGGNVCVNIKQDDADLAVLLSYNIQAGLPGSAGSGGYAGSGGEGGEGGRSYSWQVAQATTDKEGIVRTTYGSHTNPGGNHGIQGTMGLAGLSGTKGTRGMDGNFIIRVQETGETSSQSCFLQLVSFEIAPSDDGIFEPGELVFLQDLCYENSGKICYPRGRVIATGINSNQWVHFDPADISESIEEIHPSESRTVREYLQFRIRHPAEIPINTTFRTVAKIQPYGLYQRINHPIPCVQRQIEIKYPVELSHINGTPTISYNEEMTFALEVKNISSKQIGPETKEGRILRVILRTNNLYNGKSVIVRNHLEHDLSADLEEPIIYNIPELLGGETWQLSGTIQFVNSEFPINSHLPLIAELHLGTIEKPHEDFIIVQQQVFEVQLSQPFKPDPRADMLLVTNHGIRHSQIAEWEKFAQSFGSSICVWNTSLYQGFSFSLSGPEEQSIRKLFSGKTVVFLNNPAALEDHKSVQVMNYLSSQDMFEAARIHNVRCYVIGGSADFDAWTLPARKCTLAEYGDKKAVIAVKQEREQEVYDIRDKDAYKIEISEKFYLTPSAEKLTNSIEKSAVELMAKLGRKFPTQNNHLFYRSAIAATKKGLLSQKFKVGEVEIRRGLDKRYASLAYSQRPDNEVGNLSDTDMFVVLKLLPFDRKLQILTNVMLASTSKLREILGEAILSDLMDEQRAFRNQDISHIYTKKNIGNYLHFFNAFIASDYADIISSDYGQQFLQDFIIRFISLLSCIACPSLWHTPKSSLLSKHCQTGLEQLYLRIKPSADQKEISILRQSCELKFKGRSPQDILWTSCFPSHLSNNIVFDNQRWPKEAINITDDESLLAEKIPDQYAEIIPERNCFVNSTTGSVDQRRRIASIDCRRQVIHYD